MTLEQLRIFVAVANRLHVTRAAADLNLTQSAVSAAIAALERRYGIRLFDRIGRGIALTPTGHEFLHEARAVLARADAAVQVLNDLAGLKRGALTLAASQTVANYWLPPRLQQFRAAYPEIALRLDIVNTAQAAQAVRDGLADLGFVEGDVEDDALAVRKIADDRLVIVVGARHPWARQKTIAASRLKSSCWVLREPGSGTRAMFERGLRASGLKLSDLRIALELPSNEAVRAAVEASDCATAISELVAAPSLAAGTLHRIEFDLPRRAFVVLRHKERAVSKAAQALLATLLPSTAAEFR